MRPLLVAALFLIHSPARAEQFDSYPLPALAKAVADGNASEVKEITGEQIADAGGVLPDSQGTVLIVATNDRRLAKLQVQSARQKIGMETQYPILLIEKYTCFKEGTERTVKAEGRNLHLYAGSRLSLDLGQIVPEKVGGDITIVENPADPLKLTLKPLGMAKLYVLKKPVEGAVPKKADKLVVGEKFETRFFAGKYKLHDDGRRSGLLELAIDEMGEITGSYYSDKDGRKYEVKGKAGTPSHAVTLTIKFPQVEQVLNGFLFTGDAKAIAGTSKLGDREAAFYAERVEE